MPHKCKAIHGFCSQKNVKVFMVVTTYFRNSASNMPFGMMTLFPLILNMVMFELDYCSMM